jgi:hypothetical protein
MTSWRIIAATALAASVTYAGLAAPLRLLADDTACTGHETITVTSPIVAVSGQALDMTGCTITPAPGYAGNLLRNEHAIGSGRDHDITIIGGTWARGSAAGAGNDRHNLFLRHVDRITVRDARITSTGGKYAIALGDVTEATVRNISFDTASDGVHVTGPANGVDIRNLQGTTDDDMAGFTPRDYSWYDDTHGDIRNVSVDGVYPDGSLAAVKVAGGTGGITEGLSVRNVFGTTRIHPISIQQDQSGPTVANGLSFSDIDVRWADAGYNPIWLRNITSTDITFQNIRLRSAPSYGAFALIDGTSDIRVLTFDGVYIAPATAAPLVGVYGQAQVGVLELARINGPAWTGAAVRLPAKVSTIRRY